MFRDATAFDQDLSNWNVSSGTNFVSKNKDTDALTPSESNLFE
jgi:surface protein